MLAKVKRTFSFSGTSTSASSATLIAAGVALIAATYGLVRLAFGLHLPEMSAAIGFDSAFAGLISAAGSIAYGCAAVVGFLAGERHPRSLVVGAALTAGGGAAGIALSGDPASIAVWSALSSAGAGLASPAMVRILIRTLGPHDAGAAQSIVNAGTGPGLVAAGAVAWLVAPDWRLAWAIAAVCTVVAAVAVLAFGRRAAPSPSPAPALAPALPAPRAAGSPLGLPPASWWLAHRSVIAAAVLFGVAAAAVWNFGRTVLLDAGASDGFSLLSWILLGCGGAAVIATARPTRGWSPRRLWIVSTALAGVATAALGVAPGQPVVAVAASLVFGWGYVAATGALIGWTAEVEPRRASAGTAMLFVVFMGGQATGAALIGAALPSAGAAGAFGAAALFALAAGAPAVRAPRRNSPPRR